MTRLPVLVGNDVVRVLYPRRDNVIVLPLTKKRGGAADTARPEIHKEQTPVNESTLPARPHATLADWERDVPADVSQAFLALPDASSMSVARHAGEAARLVHLLSKELEWLANTSPEDEGIGQLLDADRPDRMLWRIRSAAIAEQRS